MAAAPARSSIVRHPRALRTAGVRPRPKRTFETSSSRRSRRRAEIEQPGPSALASTKGFHGVFPPDRRHAPSDRGCRLRVAVSFARPWTLPSCRRPASERAQAAVSALSSADDVPKVGATQARQGAVRQAPLVAVAQARPLVTRDRLRAIGSGEALRTSRCDRRDGHHQVPVVPLGRRGGGGRRACRTAGRRRAHRGRRARIAVATAEDQLAVTRPCPPPGVDHLGPARGGAPGGAMPRRSTSRSGSRAGQAQHPRADRRTCRPSQSRGRRAGRRLDLIATVDDRSKLRILFDAPEAFASQLAVGHPVSAVPATRSGDTYQGTITALDSRLDQASRTLRAEATIDNEGDRLRPGLSFSIEIRLRGPVLPRGQSAGGPVGADRTLRLGRREREDLEGADRHHRAQCRHRSRGLRHAEGRRHGRHRKGVQLLREGGTVRIRRRRGSTPALQPGSADRRNAGSGPPGGRGRRDRGAGGGDGAMSGGAAKPDGLTALNSLFIVGPSSPSSSIS